MKQDEKEESLQLIQALSEAKGPSGFEEEPVAIARNFASTFADTEEDHLRNLYITRRQNSGDKPLFLLDAHSDEVGMIIQSVCPNGTLHFLRLGGVTTASLPGAKVWVRTVSGEYIPGIVAAKPPHYMSEAEKNKLPAVEDMVIDVGACSAEEAVQDFGVAIGEPAVSDATFSYDAAHDVFMGKAFDCRIGCAALLETMKRLCDEDLAFDVTATISSQEEFGERGVTVAMNHVSPQAAIVFEGCPADDTFTAPYATQTALHKGPMLRYFDRSMIANPHYMRDTTALAESLGIPFQTAVRSGGGNNGAVINLSNQGVPLIVIGIPVRYAHTHYGISSFYDFEAAIDLAVTVVKNMTPEKLSSF